MLRRWLDALLDRLPLGQLKDYYASLSERERMIVLTSVGAGGVVLFLIAYATLSSIVNGQQRRLNAATEVIQKMEGLKQKYLQTRQEVERLEAVVNRTPADFSLASYLESLAKNFGVTIDSINPKSVPPNDVYTEVAVEVKIGHTTLKVLADYLYQIQHSNQLIKVNSLSIKPNFTDPAYLTAAFSVSAFTGKG